MEFKNKNKKIMVELQVYPSVLLQVGDLVESPNGGKTLLYVTDILEGVPILSDWTNVFAPSWAFYLRTDYWSFVPIMEDCSADEVDASYFDFEDEMN